MALHLLSSENQDWRQLFRKHQHRGTNRSYGTDKINREYIQGKRVKNLKNFHIYKRKGQNWGVEIEGRGMRLRRGW